MRVSFFFFFFFFSGLMVYVSEGMEWTNGQFYPGGFFFFLNLNIPHATVEIQSWVA